MKKLLLFCLILLSKSYVNGQIVVELPAENWVFQRSTDNKGSFLLSGKLNTPANELSYRLIRKMPLPADTTQWQAIPLTSVNSTYIFNAKITASGGAYAVQLRAKLGNQVVENYTIKQVGIGEVFVIAGQSNAQGQSGREAVGTTSQQVFSIPQLKTDLSLLTLRDAAPIEAWQPVYPTGIGAWCWAELGDSLVQRWKVPIMFFNVARANSTSSQWERATRGNGNYEFPNADSPYGNLRKILQFYRNLTGFRGVLWHQGETDTNEESYMQATDYFGNLVKVIKESRKDADFPIGWVVSEASYLYGKTSAKVIADQRQLVAEKWAVKGPSTDELKEPYRIDNLHFSNEGGRKGLHFLAKYWNAALTEEALKQLPPLLPADPLSLTHFCETGVQLPAGAVEHNNDSYFAASVRVLQIGTQPFKFAFVRSQENIIPTIAASGDLTCQENPVKVSLVGVPQGTPIWSSGQTGDTEIKVFFTRDVFVRVNHPKCGLSLPSNMVSIREIANNTTLVPPIISTTANYICAASPAKLTVANVPDSLEVRWSNGSKGKEIMVDASGQYTAQFRQKNGCLGSSFSNIVNLTNTAQWKPALLSASDTLLCEGQKAILKTDSLFSLRWNDGFTGASRQITQNGQFRFQYILPSGCISDFSNQLNLHFMPSPKPINQVEIANGILQIVDANSPAVKYQWRFNNQLLPNISKQQTYLGFGLYEIAPYLAYKKGVTDSLTCKASLFSKQISPVLGVNQEVPMLQVYPNPTRQSQEAILRFSTDVSRQITILRSNGQLVKQEFVQGLYYQLPTLAAGIYLIESTETATKAKQVLRLWVE